MKLQKIVNFSLRQLCPQEEVFIYHSIGQENIKGKIQNIYAAPIRLNIALQSQSEYLKHENKLSETEIKYKAYLPVNLIKNKQKTTGINLPNNGQSNNGQQDFLRPNNGQLDHGQSDHGQSDYAQPDNSLPDYAQQNNAQQNNAQLNNTQSDHAQQDFLRPAGIVRRCARSGDFIQRADKSFYLIVEVLEEFSSQGWVAVSMVEQSIEPDFTHSGWWAEEAQTRSKKML